MCLWYIACVMWAGRWFMFVSGRSGWTFASRRWRDKLFWCLPGVCPPNRRHLMCWKMLNAWLKDPVKLCRPKPRRVCGSPGCRLTEQAAALLMCDMISIQRGRQLCNRSQLSLLLLCPACFRCRSACLRSWNVTGEFLQWPGLWKWTSRWSLHRGINHQRRVHSPRTSFLCFRCTGRCGVKALSTHWFHKALISPRKLLSAAVCLDKDFS